MLHKQKGDFHVTGTISMGDIPRNDLDVITKKFLIDVLQGRAPALRFYHSAQDYITYGPPDERGIIRIGDYIPVNENTTVSGTMYMRDDGVENTFEVSGKLSEIAFVEDTPNDPMWGMELPTGMIMSVPDIEDGGESVSAGTYVMCGPEIWPELCASINAGIFYYSIDLLIVIPIQISPLLGVGSGSTENEGGAADTGGDISDNFHVLNIGSGSISDLDLSRYADGDILLIVQSNG